MTAAERTTVIALAASLMMWSPACRAPETSTVPRGLWAGLERLDPTARDRAAADPYAFFRAINHRFTILACRKLAPTPRDYELNLHGDAHLEQFAVSNQAFGLGDFDDAALGPAAVDLVRFATSLRLALRLRGWREHTREAETALFEGYRRGYEQPDAPLSEPGIVQRLSAQFTGDSRLRLDAIEADLAPIEPSFELAVKRVFGAYATRMRARDPELNAHYFDIIKMGRLTGGLGSAGTDRCLVRTEGPTSSPLDDDYIELKRVSDLDGIACLEHSPRGSARILAAQDRVAVRPDRFVGSVDIDGQAYWVHAWPHDYAELSVDDPQLTPEEVREVAFFAGQQLGRAHVRSAIHAPQSDLGSVFDEVSALAQSLAQTTIDGWQQWRQRVSGPPSQFRLPEWRRQSSHG